jgi:hypothetical protein
MDEYIKREEAIDAVSEVYYDTPDVNLSGEKFEAAINAIPAADVVEVVRCKDCYQSAVIDDVFYCTYWGKNTDENGYCHEGG